MVHSIELLLDSETESAVREQWRLLAEARLPSEHRGDSEAQRRPHVSIIACEQIPADTAASLSPLLNSMLPMPIVIGAPMIFGTANGSRPALLLVRQLVPSEALLRLQQDVVAACPPAVDNHFAAGHWVPHLTLGRRFRPEQIGRALQTLSGPLAGERAVGGRDAVLTGARYWQGDQKIAQQLV